MADRGPRPGTVPAHVVVIDSGVDPGHPGVRGRCQFRAGPAFAADRSLLPLVGGHDELGHGTAIAAAILAIAPGTVLTALRVFDDQPTCDFVRVLDALEHALALQPQIVNLSLGTTSLDHRPRLQQLVATARAAGIRLVAPASYSGLPCDPGGLPGVDAVVADPNVPPLLPERRVHDGRELWFAAAVPPRGHDGLCQLRARGESLACAWVTGLLARRSPAGSRA